MANWTKVTALVFASYQRDTNYVVLGVFVVKCEQQEEAWKRGNEDYIRFITRDDYIVSTDTGQDLNVEIRVLPVDMDIQMQPELIPTWDILASSVCQAQFTIPMSNRQNDLRQPLECNISLQLPGRDVQRIPITVNISQIPDEERVPVTVMHQVPTSQEHFPVPQHTPASPEHFPVPQHTPTSPEHFPVPQHTRTSPEHFPVPQHTPTTPEHLSVPHQEATPQPIMTENDNVEPATPSGPLVIGPGAFSHATPDMHQPMEDVRTSYTAIPPGLKFALEKEMTNNDTILLAREIKEDEDNEVCDLLYIWEETHSNLDMLMELAKHFQNAGNQKLAKLVEQYI